MAKTARRYKFHPGTLLLLQHGVNLGDVAGPLDVTTATVSRYLSGELGAPDQLFVVVAALAGRDVADQLRALIAEAAA